MHFLELKLLYFDDNFIEICTQFSTTGSDNGLAPGDKPLFEPMMA